MGQLISYFSAPFVLLFWLGGLSNLCVWFSSTSLLADAFELRSSSLWGSRCRGSFSSNIIGDSMRHDASIASNERISSHTLTAAPVRSAVSLDRPVYVANGDRSRWISTSTSTKGVSGPSLFSDWNSDSLSSVSNLLLSGVGMYGALKGAAIVAQALGDGSLTSRRMDFQDDDTYALSSKKWSWMPRPLRVIGTKASIALGPLQRIASRVVRGPPEPLVTNDWSLCTLESAVEESPGHVRYRFQFGKANNILPLTVGQEVVLCMMDNRERVLKGAFFPVTDACHPGSFEVVCRTVDEDQVAVPMALSTEDKFQRALARVQIGDELAVRPGKQRLNGPRAHSSAPSSMSQRQYGPYGAPVPPPQDISRVLMITAGDGITPAVQLMKRFLSGGSSITYDSGDRDVLADVLGQSASAVGVDELNLVWLNDREEDFVCENEVEHFELGYSNKFSVKRLLEDDLFSPELMRDRRIYTSMSPYIPGDLAVICAQEHLVEQFRFLLQELGYPHDAIVSVVM